MGSRPRLGHLLLLLPLALISAWLLWRTLMSRDDPAEVLRALRAASGPTLPEAATCSASSRTEIEHYDRDSLYTFIDGAAEAYLAQGFQRCGAANYTFARAGLPAAEVAAEVYRFADPEGARRLFADERPATATDVDGLPQAVSDGTVLVTVSGRDYLKLTVLAGTADSSGALGAIAAAWHRGTGL